MFIFSLLGLKVKHDKTWYCQVKYSTLVMVSLFMSHMF